ncbi:MAG: hypothetical protein J6B31_05835, partial [Bacteroidaceae bacterium]|nr:hypothetical protein [Bacteroidaceae bacterium]
CPLKLILLLCAMGVLFDYIVFSLSTTNIINQLYALIFSFKESSVGEHRAARGGTTRPDEHIRKLMQT